MVQVDPGVGPDNIGVGWTPFAGKKTELSCGVIVCVQGIPVISLPSCESQDYSVEIDRCSLDNVLIVSTADG